MTIDQITKELKTDEATTLADPIIRSMAKAAVAMAEKTAPGTHFPNPSLPGSLYGALITDAARLDRLKFVAGAGPRPTGASGGYFTREDVMKDVTAAMRSAANTIRA